MILQKHNNRLALSVAIAAALGVSTAAMGQLADENPGSPGQVPTLSGGAVILWDQTDMAGGNGAPDQDFEAANDSYDSEGADDFVVPGGFQWTIQEIATVGTTDGMADSVDITFYQDNAGLPGAPIGACTYTGLIPVETMGSFTITLPTACTLTPGTYWLGQQTNQDNVSDGQHFWSNRTAANGNDAAWRNPGDGFGTGCTDWGPMPGTLDGNPGTGCGVGGGTNPDFMFSMTGIEGPLIPESVPTLSRWGVGAMIVFLVGVAGWTLTRRRQNPTV